jgi:hypothetical protein
MKSDGETRIWCLCTGGISKGDGDRRQTSLVLRLRGQIRTGGGRDVKGGGDLGRKKMEEGRKEP